MPRILTQIVDTVNREEKRVADSHGEVRQEGVGWGGERHVTCTREKLES